MRQALTPASSSTCPAGARPTSVSARLDDRWHLHGLRAVVLENRELRVVVLPEAGARIFSLVHKRSDTDLLWHHPRIPPRRTPYGAPFDNTFSGGWDELFPTAEACEFRGEAVPDHGELWALPWAWREVPTADGSACLYTSVHSPLFPVRFERWLHLEANLPYLRAKYRVTNISAHALDLIWGIHPLLAISPAHRLDLPPCELLVDHASGDHLGRPGQRYGWPHLPTQEGLHDMRLVPAAEDHSFAGHYATNTSGNWFALTDTEARVGIAFVYPPEVFRALWLWGSFGGWRGLYHLAVEPWVGFPVNLKLAVEAGRGRTVAGLETVSYEVAVTTYEGLSGVGGVAATAGRFSPVPSDSL